MKPDVRFKLDKQNSRHPFSSSPSGQSATPSQRSMEGRHTAFEQRYCPTEQPS